MSDFRKERENDPKHSLKRQKSVKNNQKKSW